MKRNFRPNEARTASDYRSEARPRGMPTERSKEILALRRQGFSRAEIAERYGISVHSVSRAVTEAQSGERGS